MTGEFDRTVSEVPRSYDQLTGLPDRAFFDASLNAAIASEPGNLGLLFIDLDGLKTANDTLGHRAGDDLLVSAATELKSKFRHTENAGYESDVAARLGGDEFAVIVRDIALPLPLHLIATRVQQEMDAAEIRVSVGAALHRSDETASSLLARADAAMYENKQLRHLAKFSTEQLGALATIEEIAQNYDIDLRAAASAIAGLKGYRR